MPEDISRINVRTGENSALLMAIYKTEEVADKFFEMEAQHLHEIIDFHGPVMELKNTPAEVPDCRGFEGAPMEGEEEIDAYHSDCNPYANFGWINLKA